MCSQSPQKTRLWMSFMFVCCQEDSGSTRLALNLDSTRAPIRPTNLLPASLCREYSIHGLSFYFLLEMVSCHRHYPHCIRHFFPSLLPFSSLCCIFSSRYHVKQCADFFNVSAEQLAEAVAQTNECYGAYNIHSTRIVFPNGSIDPWHALGITQDITPDLPAVFIKGEKRLCAKLCYLVFLI